MKHNFIKLLAVLMAAFIPAGASAQYFEVGGIVYGVTQGQTAEVQPYYYLLDNPYSGAVTIPETVEHDGTTYTVTSLGDEAFYDCGGVSSLTLPATVRSIGSYCFYNSTFTSLELPDSLRTIGDNAFLYSCVTSLHLPACFEGYGECAFWARNLASVTVDEGNPRFRSIGGWLYSKDSLTLCVVPVAETGTINVPSYVRHIGHQAFSFNSRATSVSLPEGLVSIGDFAFNCCSKINNVVVPSTVTRIGLCPFSYCPQLTNLSIASGNSHYVMDGLMIYSAGYDTLVSCHKSGTTVTLNPNVKVLGGFENNTWVRNINIPAGVTDILDNCFNGCAITTIALPAHMNSIGRLALATNDKLTHVTMPQTLRSMGEKAFEWCMGLTSIVIPDSLRVIPKEAFNSCPRLGSITWGNAVEEIGYAAFWAMSASHLDLPPTLRKLNDLAFAACANNLRTVTIHSQLDTMGEAVFRHANLNRIRFSAAVPPAVTGEGPLYDIGRLDSIVVPCGSLNTWLADSYWGQFADKYVEDCNIGIGNPDANTISIYTLSGRIVVEGAEGEAVRIYDITGRSVRNEALHTGVYIVKVGDRPARKIVVMK